VPPLTPTPNPSPDELRGFLLGTTPSPADAERLAAWAAAHPAAVESLGGVASGDILVTVLRDVSSHECPQDPEVEQIIRRVSQELETNPPSVTPPPVQFGDYRVVRQIGSGGMGLVYEAEDVRLNRHVAVKVLNTTLARRPDAKARFLREARAAAAVEHENVVPIHHVGEDEGVPFLVMPLLKGESLDARLKRDGLLPVSEVVRLGREVATGLAAAHARGMIHRDIKPANIWLDADTGKARILDFGLARAADGADGLTAEGAVRELRPSCPRSRWTGRNLTSGQTCSVSEQHSTSAPRASVRLPAPH
jgi:serine/threonine protein kinase